MHIFWQPPTDTVINFGEQVAVKAKIQNNLADSSQAFIPAGRNLSIMTSLAP